MHILYIGGWGRCGSTLLDMLLGEFPGVFSAGEVRELWLRGCLENRPCGCGAPFADCTFWRRVGELAYGGWAALDVDALLATRYAFDRPWGIPRLLSSRRHNGALTYYCDALTRLYRAIQSASRAHLVIDSSKIASHALLLRRAAGLDIRVVHLARDSRGVAHSVQKHVEKPIDDARSTSLPRHGPVPASVRYAVYNTLASRLRTGGPFARLRYEDLVDEPAESLRRVLGFAGHPQPGVLPFIDGHVATLTGNHMVDGNPVRFRTGPVALRRDEQWRRDLPQLHRRIVTTMTLPLLAAYGYLD